MPRRPNQKQKLLWLWRILQRQTDAEHPLTLREIQEALERKGIAAERKSLYDDFETLRQCGFEVEKSSSKPVGYYLRQEPFETAELKLLADIIQCSKFITAKKSEELIRKLAGFLSVYQAGQLQRQVYVSGRVKTPNERIYYNVDAIHTAIATGKQIRFRYLEWALDASSGKLIRRCRRGGGAYRLSPWALSWDDENYYLIGCSKNSGIRHYRVDKMEDIRLCKEDREGQALFQNFDLASHVKSTFGMYGGRAERLLLRFPVEMAGVVADRFGQDVFTAPDGEGFFKALVQVEVSPQFYGWLFGLGSAVRILSPQWVRDGYEKQLAETAAAYQADSDKGRL